MEKLIIFGGTFDPVHNGHLRIAKYAVNKLKAKLVFVPAKNPRWKKPHASIIDRYNMLKIVIKATKSRNITLSNYEAKSTASTNYTINTIKYFINQNKHKEVYLLIGADQVESFHDWKDADLISKLVKIIYVERPNIILKSDNIKKFNMIPLSFDSSGTVSSNSIRTMQELDTPIEVLDYIEKHNLYYIKDISPYYDAKRFMHAKSVARLAYDIAVKNNRWDAYRSYIAGLLHDLGKKVNDFKMEEIMNKYYKEYKTNLPKTLYHQFVGAYLAETIFKINNKEIIDAIKFHATGKANMKPIGKIVYASDKLDPLRGYDSKKLIRACYINYYSGFQDVLKANKEHLIKHKLNFDNPLTKACMDQYLGEKND